jgi:hypothetical protein
LQKDILLALFEKGLSESKKVALSDILDSDEFDKIFEMRNEHPARQSLRSFYGSCECKERDIDVIPTPTRLGDNFGSLNQ